MKIASIKRNWLANTSYRLSTIKISRRYGGIVFGLKIFVIVLLKYTVQNKRGARRKFESYSTGRTYIVFCVLVQCCGAGRSRDFLVGDGFESPAPS